MGNWRSAYLVGTCRPDQVDPLRAALDPGTEWDNFHPLCDTHSLQGLGNWAAPTITAVGNLAERDYSVEDVAATLSKIVKTVPSLMLKVHLGGEQEDKRCIATVTVEGGIVTVDEPEIEILPELGDEQYLARLLRAMGPGQASPL